MPIVFVDECGYTGPDLANESQPVFAVASHSFAEDECRELIRRHFAPIRARELKHSALARRPAQQAMVLSFLDEIGTMRQSIRCAALNKLFCLATKVVDLIIEPMAHDDGLDLYKDGLHIALSNVLYFSLRQRGGVQGLHSYLAPFQALAREPTMANLAAFAKAHAEASKSVLPKELSVPISGALLRYGPRLLDRFDENSLDLPFTTCVTLFGAWRASTSERITVVHDDSSYMARRKDLWEFIVSKDRTRYEQRFGDLNMVFPIGIEETAFTSSAQSMGLQVADVIAGGLSAAIKAADDYGKRVGSVIGDWDLTARIGPETDLGKVRARMSGRSGSQMINYLMKEGVARRGKK